jgi:hypothetical protein
LEEVFLLLLIVIEAYKLTGVSILSANTFVIQHNIPFQNYIWFGASIVAFILGHLIITKRDLSVQLIHNKLFHVVASEAKERVINSNVQIVILALGQLMFAIIIALCILLYLDPSVDINYPNGSPIPFLYKAIAFIVFLGIGLLLFSHTKKAREFYYGPTLAHKKFHHGPHELRHSRNRQTGTIRIRPRHKLSYHPHKFR